MAGTIIVDRIESDASYTSTINVANRITFSNTVNFGVFAGTAPVAGFYLPTTNNLAFTTASTERMRIDSSGNVGIGTATPSAPLDVKVGTGNFTVGLQGAGNALLTASSTMQLDAAGASSAMVFKTVGTERMRIDSSGNVGIGTSSPNARLEALGSTAGAEISRFEGNYSASGTVNLTNWRRSGGAVASVMRYNDANTDMEFGTTTSHSQAFITGGTERARIDTSGNLLVGTTSTTPNPGVSIFPNGAISQGNSAGSSGYEFLSFRRSATQIGSITQNGTTAVAYNTSSDYRLKEAIAPMTGALATVSALKPVTYKWKADGSNGQGFIAHELQAVVPDCVVGEKDAVDTDGNPKYQGIDTSFLVATLTAAIQEQQAIIQTLTDRITALESN